MKKMLPCPRCKTDILMPKVKKTDDKHLVELFSCPECDQDLAYIDGELIFLLEYEARLNFETTAHLHAVMEKLQEYIAVKDLVMQCALIELNKNQIGNAKSYLVDHLKSIGGLPPNKDINTEELWKTQMALIMKKPAVQ